MEYIWSIKEFNALTPTELYELLRLRVDVFVVEQNCPYHELDNRDLDDQTRHIRACSPGGGLLAYARLLGPGTHFKGVGMGRVVVDKRARGMGLARDLVKKALENSWMLWPGIYIQIGAQAYLEEFYSSFGFVTRSAPYLEDGIPHIDMVLNQT